MRSLSAGDLNACNSRSLPHLPLIAAVEVPGGRLSTDFAVGVDPVSRRSLSSLRSARVRTWCVGALRPGAGGSLSSVAVETPLTSSASSAATTAGGGGGSDVSGCCVVDSMDDEEPPTAVASTSTPPPPATSVTSQNHTERHAAGGLPTLSSEDWNQSDLRRGVPDNVCQRTGDPSNLTTCNDEDETVERLQQQKRQRRFRRRHRRAFVGGQPSSNSLDELQYQYRTRLKLYINCTHHVTVAIDKLCICRTRVL